MSEARGGISIARVIAGGALTGVILAIADFLVEGAWHGRAWEEVARVHALAPNPAIAAPYYMLAAVGEGLLMVFLYAALSPRFGARPRTAMLAGFVVWLAAELLLAGNWVIGLATAELHVTGAGLRLVASLLAPLAGARLYRDRS